MCARLNAARVESPGNNRLQALEHNSLPPTQALEPTLQSVAAKFQARDLDAVPLCWLRPTA